MAEESIVISVPKDMPVKRPRDGEEEIVVLQEVKTNEKDAEYSISSVIPGWFSEISPMWPGLFFFLVLIRPFFMYV